MALQSSLRVVAVVVVVVVVEDVVGDVDVVEVVVEVLVLEEVDDVADVVVVVDDIDVVGGTVVEFPPPQAQQASFADLPMNNPCVGAKAEFSLLPHHPCVSYVKQSSPRASVQPGISKQSSRGSTFWPVVSATWVVKSVGRANDVGATVEAVTGTPIVVS